MYALSISSSGSPFILNTGESLWLAIIWKPLKDFSGRTKAMSAEPFLVTKYFPPLFNCQSSPSYKGRNPSSTRMFFIFSTAKKALTLPSRKSISFLFSFFTSAAFAIQTPFSIHFLYTYSYGGEALPVISIHDLLLFALKHYTGKLPT